MKRILWVIVLLVGFRVYGQELKMVAKVNSEIITSKDLDDHYQMFKFKLAQVGRSDEMDDAVIKKQALEKLIDDKIILDAAKKEAQRVADDTKAKDYEKKQWEVSAADIEGEFNKIIASFPSREEFEQALVEQGLNNALFRQQLKDQQLARKIVQKEVKSRVNVSPQEVSEYYREDPERFHSPAEYVLWMGRFDDVAAWEEFEKFFREKGIAESSVFYSDTLTKVESILPELRPEFAQPLEGRREDEHFMVTIDDEIYFIYVDQIHPPQLMPLEEVEGAINSFLWNQKFKEEYELWLARLKERSLVKIYLDE